MLRVFCIAALLVCAVSAADEVDYYLTTWEERDSDSTIFGGGTMNGRGYCTLENYEFDLLVYGGTYAGFNMPIVYRYRQDSGEWEPVGDGDTNPGTEPSARHGAASATVGSDTYFFNGCEGEFPCDVAADGLVDIWHFDWTDDSWETISVVGATIPDARWGASAHYYRTESGNDVIVIYGGKTDTGVTDDAVYYFDLATNRYNAKAQTGTRPNQLYGHASVVNNGTMWVWGGYEHTNSDAMSAAMWTFDLESLVWTDVTSSLSGTGPAEGDAFGLAFLINDVMLILSGEDSGGNLDANFYVLDTASRTWDTQLLTVADSTRVASCGAVFRGNARVFGGYDSTGDAFERSTNTPLEVAYKIRPIFESVDVTTSGDCGGDELTITGQDFVNTQSYNCYFGDAYVTAATRDSDTQIRCDSPAGAIGTYDFAVGAHYDLLTEPLVDFDIVEDDADGTKFTVSGITSVEVGTDLTMTVTAKTSCSSNRISGGDTLVVEATRGAETITATIDDHGDGTYTATFLHTVAGVWNLDVTANGVEPDTYPATFTYQPGLPASVDTLTPLIDDTEVTVDAEFSILARDKYSNLCDDAGGLITVTAVHEDDAGIVIIGDVAYDGSSLAGSFTATTAGTYIVTVTLSDGNGTVTTVDGSGFEVTFTAGPYTVATSSLENLLLSEPRTVGVAHSVFVQLRDTYGNARSDVIDISRFDAEFTYTKDSTQKSYVEINGPLNNGQYNVSIIGTRPGVWSLEVTLDSGVISGGAKTLTYVNGDLQSASKINVYGTGIERAQGGRNAIFYMQMRDPYGNNNTNPWGGDDFTLVGDFVNQEKTLIEYESDGRYRVVYQPKSLNYYGTQELTIIAGPDEKTGTKVGNSPYKVSLEVSAVFFAIILVFTCLGMLVCGIAATAYCHTQVEARKYHKITKNPDRMFAALDYDNWATEIAEMDLAGRDIDHSGANSDGEDGNPDAHWEHLESDYTEYLSDSV